MSAVKWRSVIGCDCWCDTYDDDIDNAHDDDNEWNDGW